jgi:hypothetical protein
MYIYVYVCMHIYKYVYKYIYVYIFGYFKYMFFFIFFLRNSHKHTYIHTYTYLGDDGSCEEIYSAWTNKKAKHGKKGLAVVSELDTKVKAANVVREIRPNTWNEVVFKVVIYIYKCVYVNIYICIYVWSCM